MSGRAGSTNLDSPRAVGVDGIGIPEAVASSRRESTAKAGTGEATSSLHTRRRTVDDWGVLIPEENLGVREVRIFPSLAYLDGCLPKCVVDYIEQLCLTVYNCFARMTGGEEIPIQQARPDDDDAGSGSGAGVSTEMETVNPATRAALEQLPDHIKQREVPQDQPAAEPARPASPERRAQGSGTNIEFEAFMAGHLANSERLEALRRERGAAELARPASPQQRPLLNIDAHAGDAPAATQLALSPLAVPKERPTFEGYEELLAKQAADRARIIALMGKPGDVQPDSPVAEARPAHEHWIFKNMLGGQRSPTHAPLEAPADASSDGEKPAAAGLLGDDSNAGGAAEFPRAFNFRLGQQDEQPNPFMATGNGSQLQAPANASGDAHKPVKEPELFDDDNFLEAWTKGIALTTASQATPAGNASTVVATQPKPASPKADSKKAEVSAPAKKGLEAAPSFQVNIADCNGRYLLTAHKRLFELQMDVDVSRWKKGTQIRVEDGANLAGGWRRCINADNFAPVGIREVTDVRSPELSGTETSLPRSSKWDNLDFYQ